MLKLFHDLQQRDWRVQILMETLEQYNEQEVAIYGTGKHTEWLLDQIGQLVNKVACLLDRDENVEGERKFGLPVCKVEEAMASGIKAIVISSTFEQAIYERLQSVRQQGVEIIRLYSQKAISNGKKSVIKRMQMVARDSQYYTFVDRRKGQAQLAIILAGYKPYLWPFTLERLARYAPSNVDMCLVSSGLYSEELARWAERHQWSYLFTKINDVSLAQNLAIAEHKEAEWIFKLDEDIFVTDRYFQHLRLGYERILEEGLFHPGFVAPIINLNGYTYVEFLKALGLDQEYKRVFRELKYAANGIKCHSDPEAARWIWRHSLPLDEVAQKISDKPFDYSTVPHRFSIGAILFKREYWEQIGGFKIGAKEGMLGVDEEDLCQKCVELSRVMCVVHNVFCGHFSFFLQEEGMKEFLEKHKELFIMG
ncbi:hypothetical protein [Geobacillus sp. Y412MC52]|uniref:hypothetical protein n=1 Tax=Geobacillus sp. (strain Y412MC52) TaxID=550542 RepID=UPI00018C1C7D|nr:hypothetical protein [Geobacillus sp. Y412MC52]ADU95599.1 hypothetical protein GYMC52_3247 [Geobacillus sp. Y412MC52]